MGSDTYLVQNPLLLPNRLAPPRIEPSLAAPEFAPPPASSSPEFQVILYIKTILAGLLSLFNSLRQKTLPQTRVVANDLRDNAVADDVSLTNSITNDASNREPIKEADILPQNSILDDNDCSLILLDSDPFVTDPLPSKSIFDTIYGNEEIESPSLSDQYGTSLALSQNSRYMNASYTPNSLIPLSVEPFSEVDSYASSDPKLQVNLDFLNKPPTPKSEYDAIISSWYLPPKPMPKYKYSLIDTIVDVTSTLSVTDFFRLEREKLIDKISKERQLSTSRINDLTSDQLNVVKKYWSSNAITDIIVSQYSIDISIRDMQTLYYGRWLNDNVMDFYFNLITDKIDSCFGWTTHFFTTLQARGYQGVGRWSKRKKVNVNTTNLILIPINIMSTHWALAAVDNEYKTITYYDSLSSNGNLSALLLIKGYMIEEGKKNNSPIDYEEFELLPNFETPQQQNGSDCGVFTCICAKYIATNKLLTYSQNDMKIFRRRMSYEIINKTLLH